MKWLLHIFWLQMLAGCGVGNGHEHSQQTLDSLGGSLQQVLHDLRKTDTVVAKRAIERSLEYRLFIRNNVVDTLPRTEADGLQIFFSAAENLNAALKNRKLLLQRGQLLQKQLSDLGLDVRRNSVDGQQLIIYINQERNALVELSNAAADQQKTIQTSVEQLRSSVKVVEQLIRRHNRGQLPIVIRDTLPF